MEISTPPRHGLLRGGLEVAAERRRHGAEVPATARECRVRVGRADRISTSRRVSVAYSCRGRGVAAKCPQHIHIAATASPRLVSADYPRRGRGVAAKCPRNIHVAAAASPRLVSAEYIHVAAAASPRRVSTEYIHAVAAASRLVSAEYIHAVAAAPRLASAEYPCRGRGVAATGLRGISTSRPRRRRDLSLQHIHVAAADSPPQACWDAEHASDKWLAPGWVAGGDPVYYYNYATGVSVWEPPPPPDPLSDVKALLKAARDARNAVLPGGAGPEIAQRLLGAAYCLSLREVTKTACDDALRSDLDCFLQEERAVSRAGDGSADPPRSLAFEVPRRRRNLVGVEISSARRSPFRRRWTLGISARHPAASPRPASDFLRRWSEYPRGTPRRATAFRIRRL